MKYLRLIKQLPPRTTSACHGRFRPRPYRANLREAARVRRVVTEEDRELPLTKVQAR